MNHRKMLTLNDLPSKANDNNALVSSHNYVMKKTEQIVRALYARKYDIVQSILFRRAMGAIDMHHLTMHILPDGSEKYYYKGRGLVVFFDPLMEIKSGENGFELTTKIDYMECKNE